MTGYRQGKLLNTTDFSRDLEDPSPNLSPTRREALIAPPSLVGKGAGGLGLSLTLPHDVKSQLNTRIATHLYLYTFILAKTLNFAFSCVSPSNQSLNLIYQAS